MIILSFEKYASCHLIPFACSKPATKHIIMFYDVNFIENAQIVQSMVVNTYKQQHLQQTFDSFSYNLCTKCVLQRQKHIKKIFYVVCL